MTVRNPNWPTRHNGREGCAWCGAPITQPATGRPRGFCCHNHACLAHRLRKALRAMGVFLHEREDVEFALIELGLPVELAEAL